MEICIPRAFLWTKFGIYLCSSPRVGFIDLYFIRFIRLFCYRYWATSFFKIIDYYGMCTNILNGEVLDHNPLKQGAYSESQPDRYQRMLDRYKALFAMPPPQPYWEVPVSAVETMDNPSPTYLESSSTPATSEVTPNKKRAKTSQSGRKSGRKRRSWWFSYLSTAIGLSRQTD